MSCARCSKPAMHFRGRMGYCTYHFKQVFEREAVEMAEPELKRPVLSKESSIDLTDLKKVFEAIVECREPPDTLCIGVHVYELRR